MNSFLRTAAIFIIAATSGSIVVAQETETAFDAFQARDYATALKKWRSQSEQGNSSAQINLGILYAEGKGVLKDPTTAHMWYNIGSATASNEMASVLGSTYRNHIELIMTREQIAKATRRAKVCISSDYRDCD